MSIRKPKILHYLYKDNNGGGPKNVISLIEHYRDVSIQEIVTSSEAKLGAWCKLHFPAAYHLLPKPAFMPLHLFKLYLTVRRMKPDVVITHGQWGGPLMSIVLLLTRTRRSVFITQWCSLYESRDAYRAARNFFVEWLTIKGHDWIVCVSEGNLRQFFYAGLVDDRSRVRVIPNSVNIPAEILPFVTQNLKVQFVFLARFVRQKRVDWLLKAWSLAIKKGMSNSELLLLGDGPLLDQMRKMAGDLAINDSIQFLGFTSKAQEILAASDVLLCTSLYEGHANVILEAMALGKPVLAMSADGIRESFRHGVEGYLVELGDVNVFADYLVRMSSSATLRAEMGIKGLERARNYSSTSERDAYIELLEQVIR